MSEYCSSCYEEDIHSGIDINLYDMAYELKKVYMMSFLCEGCNRRAISKEEGGTYQIAREVKGEYQWETVKRSDLRPTKPFKRFRSDPLSRFFR